MSKTPVRFPGLEPYYSTWDTCAWKRLKRELDAAIEKIKEQQEAEMEVKLQHKCRNELMTHDEIKDRLDEGEDPLDLSIEAWMRKAMYLLKNGAPDDKGALCEWHQCALCVSHGYGEYRGMTCDDCVLYKFQNAVCNGKTESTAYGRFHRNQTFDNAMAMVNTLRECKEWKQEQDKPQFYIWEEGKEPEGKVGLRLEKRYNRIVLVTCGPGARGFSILGISDHGTLRRYGGINNRSDGLSTLCGAIVLDE